MPALLSRITASAAVVLTLSGGAAVVLAVAALPAPWAGGYVSEAGVAGQPDATRYLLGVLGVSVGLVLLGVAVGGRTRLAGVLLAIAGGLGGVSGTLRCSPGCPLPPYEPSTAADLVHAGASVLAVAAVFFAMLCVAVSGTPRVSRCARVALVLVTPLVFALGVALLALGRRTPTSILERATLTTLYLWVTATAVLVATRPFAAVDASGTGGSWPTVPVGSATGPDRPAR